MDRELLDEWAKRAQLDWPSQKEALRTWSDGEVFYEGREHRGRLVVDLNSRGESRVLASFAHVDDADRMLLLLLGIAARSLERAPSLSPATYAGDVLVEAGPTSILLSWPGGDADFPPGIAGSRYSKLFSYVVSRPGAEISRALSHPEGVPLFPS